MSDVYYRLIGLMTINKKKNKKINLKFFLFFLITNYSDGLNLLVGRASGGGKGRGGAR